MIRYLLPILLLVATPTAAEVIQLACLPAYFADERGEGTIRLDMVSMRAEARFIPENEGPFRSEMEIIIANEDVIGASNFSRTAAETAGFEVDRRTGDASLNIGSYRDGKTWYLSCEPQRPRF